MTTGRLLAVSDLHVAYAENRKIVERLRPTSDSDWLLIAGDVGERVADIVHALTELRRYFSTVVWVPGNHDLWTHERDPVRLRGEARYLHLVDACRRLGVITPEDPYPVWEGPDGPVRVVPLFLLYDYTFRAAGLSQEEALREAERSGIVCTDEYLLHPDPYPSREAWCAARCDLTEKRLDALDDGLPTVLVNHFPLVRHPTAILRYPQFAQWCGTTRTADWHIRYRAAAVVYGHLHIPRVTHHDGVRFVEVSVGYPREWGDRGHPHGLLRQILPMEPHVANPAWPLDAMAE